MSLNLARLLKEERERQGVSMNRLAEAAGLHHTAISLIERGLRNPSFDTLVRIADVLKIDLGRFVSLAYDGVDKCTVSAGVLAREKGTTSKPKGE